MLSGPFQILGQQYHRNEYHTLKILRKANLFWKDSFCTREKTYIFNSPRTFKEDIFKALWECLISMCAILRLSGIGWSFEHHQSYGFTCYGIYMLAISIFHLGGRGEGVSFLQKQLRNVCWACIYIFQGTGSLVILQGDKCIVLLLIFGNYVHKLIEQR